MNNTKPGSRRSRGAVGRVAEVRRPSFVHCHGRRYWRVGILAAALVVVAIRLLVLIGGLIARGIRRLAHRQVSRTPPGLTPDGWGWRLSGMFALLCIAAPVASAASIIVAGGPMFQLPKGVYVGLMLLALASLAGVILAPLTVRA